MAPPYEDFHELILVGYRALLTPEQIYRRFVDGGLPRETLPSSGTIRAVGCELIGPACRWRKQNGMTSWNTGIHVKRVKNSLQARKEFVK